MYRMYRTIELIGPGGESKEYFGTYDPQSFLIALLTFLRQP